MSQQTDKRSNRPPASEAAAKRAGAKLDQPVSSEKKPTAPAMSAATSSPSTPAATPTKALTPLAAAWPGADSAPAKPTPTPPTSAAPRPNVSSAPVARPQTHVQAQPAQTASPSAPKTTKVSFTLTKPDAKRVSLCGDFNGWAPGRTPMIRKEGGQWEVSMQLKPGKYQYKFVADDQWLVDPTALENVPNPHGSLNSVREVRN